MNKNFLLFTLILMVSCVGILGVVEKSNASVCTDEGGACCNIHENGCKNFVTKPGASSSCPGDDNYCCKIGDCYSDCELKKDQECLDITKCTGGVSVVTNGPRKCSSGRTCCKIGSCKTETTSSPMLPTEPSASAPAATDSSGITIQEPTSSSGGSTVNLSDKPLSKILEDLIKWLLKIVILIAILMIIVSGAMYMISAGDQQKADTAKKALTYAILGLLVVALAYAIVNTLVDILAG